MIISALIFAWHLIAAVFAAALITFLLNPRIRL